MSFVNFIVSLVVCVTWLVVVTVGG